MARDAVHLELCSSSSQSGNVGSGWYARVDTAVQLSASLLSNCRSRVISDRRVCLENAQRLLAVVEAVVIPMAALDLPEEQRRWWLETGIEASEELLRTWAGGKSEYTPAGNSS